MKKTILVLGGNFNTDPHSCILLRKQFIRDNFQVEYNPNPPTEKGGLLIGNIEIRFFCNRNDITPEELHTSLLISL